MKKKIIILLISCFMQTVSGQTRSNYSDDLLTSSFELFQSADFEFANYMLPFIRKRFIDELKDTLSFTNSYDSLSSCIGIRYTSDSLLKTYCWSERSGGCCHNSATFAQFRTKIGDIKYVDLEKQSEDGTEIFITDVQWIEMNDTPFYLLLGWGTCCGGKHYEIAKVYQITYDTLIQIDSVFGKNMELVVGANRSQKIDLKYSPELKILTYNGYVFDDHIGFYKGEKLEEKWQLTKNGFKRISK